MPTIKLSIRDCLRFGWETFKIRAWFLIGATLIFCVADVLIQWIGKGFRASFAAAGLPGGSLVDLIVYTVLATFLSMSFAYFTLAAHDNPKSVSLRALGPRTDPFWKYLGAYLLVIIVIIVGFILLIIPGLIASLMFPFTSYLVIERHLGPIEAMKESARITKGNRWKLLGLFLAAFALNIVGFICLLIGLFITIPVSVLAIAHAYRLLSGTNKVAV